MDMGITIQIISLEGEVVGRKAERRKGRTAERSPAREIALGRPMAEDHHFHSEPPLGGWGQKK